MALLTLLISALALLISSIAGLSDAGAPSDPVVDVEKEAAASGVAEPEPQGETLEYEGYRHWGKEGERFPRPLFGQLDEGLHTALSLPYVRFKDPCSISDQEAMLEHIGPKIRHGLTEDDPIPDDLLQELEWAYPNGVYTEMRVDPWSVYLFGQQPMEDDPQYALAAYIAYGYLVDPDEDSEWYEGGSTGGPTWVIEYTAQRWDCSHPRYANRR